MKIEANTYTEEAPYKVGDRVNTLMDAIEFETDRPYKLFTGTGTVKRLEQTIHVYVDETVRVNYEQWIYHVLIDGEETLTELSARFLEKSND